MNRNDDIGISDEDSNNQKLSFEKQSDGTYDVIFSGIKGTSQPNVNMSLRYAIEECLEDNNFFDIHCDTVTEQLTNFDKRIYYT